MGRGSHQGTGKTQEVLWGRRFPGGGEPLVFVILDSGRMALHLSWGQRAAPLLRAAKDAP